MAAVSHRGPTVPALVRASVPAFAPGLLRVLVALLLAGALGGALLPATAAAAPQQPQEPPTYTNPVSDTVDTFPDPVTVRAKDGYWYAYGTTNPIFQSRGEDGERYLPILRSDDLVRWEHADDVFTRSTLPNWFSSDARLWAPDVRYLDGRYYLYYSVAQRGAPNTIGVVTAPTPTGPWSDSGGPVVEPGACPTGDIDPAQFTDTDGTKYLYWGSYDVLCVARMNAEGTRVVGEATEVAEVRRGEAAYVVRRGGYYYLFYSEAGCCQGAFSGYQVKVGRAESPLGPFVDRNGTPLTAATTKESFVLAANGNRWIGPGHNSMQTDLAGRTWLVYHAIPEENPNLDPVETVPGRRLSARPMLIDRLDWADGWPVVRGGRWASEDPQPAPATTWDVGSEFNERPDIDAAWRREGAARGGWQLDRERDSGGYVSQRAPTTVPAYLVSRDDAPAEPRAEADLRISSEVPGGRTGAAGLVAAYRDADNHIVAWLDATRGALVTDVRVGGTSAGQQVTPLPAGFDFGSWHHVAVEIRGTRLRAEVTHARLADPLAVQERAVPREAVRPASVGVAARGARAEADNVGAVSLFTPEKEPETGSEAERAAPPEVGDVDPAYSDEFDDGVDPGSADGSPWSWVRDPEGGESGGAFRWTAEDFEELFRGRNDASVLVRDAPDGAYTVETKLTFDGDQPAQQAGLILYGGDDRYVKLVHAALRFAPRGGGEVIRYTEFAKEAERPAVGAPAFYGPTYVGTPAETMWLRLHHRVDPEGGDHEIRAATSRDGENWVWGAVWTLPADTDVRIGLVVLNRPGATAAFDYLRTHRP